MLSNQKPPFGSRLDLSHPLAQDLVSCFVLNEGSGFPCDLVDGETLTSGVLGQWSTNGLEFDGSTNGIYGSLRNLRKEVTGNKLSFFIKCDIKTIPSSTKVVAGYTDQAASVGWALNINNTANGYNFYCSSAGRIRSSSAITTGNQSLCFTKSVSPAVGIIYKNGTIIGSEIYGTLANCTYLAISRMCMGDSPYIAAKCNVKVNLLCVWKRVLSAQEVIQLHEMTAGW